MIEPMLFALLMAACQSAGMYFFPLASVKPKWLMNELWPKKLLICNEYVFSATKHQRSYKTRRLTRPVSMPSMTSARLRTMLQTAPFQ